MHVKVFSFYCFKISQKMCVGVSILSLNTPMYHLGIVRLDYLTIQVCRGNGGTLGTFGGSFGSYNPFQTITYLKFEAHCLIEGQKQCILYEFITPYRVTHLHLLNLNVIPKVCRHTCYIRTIPCFLFPSNLLVRTLKGTPNLNFLSGVLTISTG